MTINSHFENVRFSDLIGKTIRNINCIEYTPCADRTDPTNQLTGSSMINIKADDAIFIMNHITECSEYVYLADVCGDINDILNSPIIKAEECISKDRMDGKHEYDSFTWTFYHLSTIKGTVTLRWFGGANGWYSETVDFYKLIKSNIDKE